MDYAVTKGAHQFWNNYNCLEAKSSPSATHRQQMMDLAETFKLGKNYMAKAAKNAHIIPVPTDRYETVLRRF